ncbi:hypothetical protein P4118_19875 [Pseudomonas aeruginosa]|nr:hypothetical protein [Pseudomonas aeruginosa]
MDKTQMFPGNHKARYPGWIKDVDPRRLLLRDFYTDRLSAGLERDRQPGKPFFAYLAKYHRGRIGHYRLRTSTWTGIGGNDADGYEALAASAWHG